MVSQTVIKKASDIIVENIHPYKIILFGLLIAMGLLWQQGAEETYDSIAVLPFINFNDDPEQEYFSDGMTEALIANLTKIKALRVISRTSVMRYKNTHKTLPEIARELDVDIVIEGSVLRNSGRVRIIAQLLHARTDRHLWSTTYERDVQDILVLQSDMARAIVEEIRVELTPRESKNLEVVNSVTPTAYEAYLKGRYFLDQRTREGLEKSMAFFQQSNQLDPSYSEAYAGSAYAQIILCLLGEHTSEVLTRILGLSEQELQKLRGQGTV